MNSLEKMDIIQKAVKSYVESYIGYAQGSELTNLIQHNDHIVMIGTSIMATKWGIGWDGGSFVQSVVDNDLMGAVGRADHINSQMLKFYCSLMYNLGMPEELN